VSFSDGRRALIRHGLAKHRDGKADVRLSARFGHLELTGQVRARHAAFVRWCGGLVGRLTPSEGPR
jgi:hypothetical protein